jgi:hypothetical protein
MWLEDEVIYMIDDTHNNSVRWVPQITKNDESYIEGIFTMQYNHTCNTMAIHYYHKAAAVLFPYYYTATTILAHYYSTTTTITPPDEYNTITPPRMIWYGAHK